MKRIIITGFILLAFVGMVMAADPGVYGVSWNSSNSSPTLQRVDSDGNPVTMSTADFNTIPPWSLIRRCVISSPSNTITYGSNNRGDGLDLTGASGAVMVEIPAFGINITKSGTVTTYLISSNISTKYPLHPAFYQRGDLVTPNLTRKYIYLGSYAAVPKVNSSGILMLSSFTVQQPWTGYLSNTADGYFALGFANSGVAPIKGSFINGTTSGKYGTLVDNITESGDYATGTATGTLYLKQTLGGTATSVYTAGETITQDGVGFGVVDISKGNNGVTLSLSDAISYANTRGKNYGVENVFSQSAVTELFIVEMASLNSQTAVGLGITSFSTGTGFAGNITGANSLDSSINSVNATGAGSGVNGLVPIAYRGITDLWGNVNQVQSGMNFNASGYSTAFQNGTSDIDLSSTILPGYNFTADAPVTSGSAGYVTAVYDDLTTKHFFIPSATGGSSSTFFSDYNPGYVSGVRVPARGNSWTGTTRAGLFWLDPTVAATTSSKNLGSRLEYIPAPTLPNFVANTTSGFTLLPVKFTDTSTGSPTNWSWDFNNDGIIESTLQNPTYTYVLAGTYTVNLTVNNTANPDRTESKVGYITVTPAGYPFPNFTCNATLSTGPDHFVTTQLAPVLFNQTSVSTLAFTAFNWSWGDGTYNVTTNATVNMTHAYASTGYKDVSLTATTAGGTNTTTKTNFMFVAGSGLTPLDLWMTQQYILTLHVADAATGEIIPDATFTDSSTLVSTTTTNGTFYLTYPFGQVAGVVTSSGYNGKAFSIFMDADTEQTVQLTKTTPGGTKNTWYTLQLVRIKIVDAYGVPLPGSNLTVNYIASTLPSTDTSWLISAFGIDEDVAGQMVNSSLAMQGYTVDDGALAFMMFPALTYRLYITNSTIGLSNTRDLSPKDTDYTIYCPLASQHAVNNTLTAAVASSLPFYQLNASGGYNLSMIYHDPQGYTTNLHFIVKDYTHGRVTVLDRNWGNPGTNVIVDNYTVLVPLGQEYIWQYNATKV